MSPLPRPTLKCALVSAAGLVLLACGSDSTEPSVATLTISTATVANAVVGTPYSQSVAANGGTSPYTWTISSGSLPAGLTLSGSSGRISGTPTTPSDEAFTVQVASADGQVATADLVIEVFAPLEITTTSLPSGVQDAPYDASLTASGGDGTHAWNVISGTLPVGLSLTSDGQISGTPTATGSTTITFGATSGDGQTDSVPLDLEIFGALSITTVSLSNAVQNEAYSDTVQAGGGDGSNGWSVTAGSLPTGLDLDPATGVISGTPTTVESATFTVQVESGDGQTAEVELSVSVYPLLQVTTASLASGIQGVAYADTVQASGGDEAYGWALVSGTLPAGLSLDTGTGIISGTPTAAGSAQATFEVTSGDGQAAEVDLTIDVYGVLTIATASLANAVQGAAYADTLQASGGDGGNSWTLTAGTLPSGLSLDPGGEISGTPTTVETGTFTVQVESGDGQTAEVELSVSVYPLLQVTTASLASGIQGEAYADTVHASGGDGAFSWSVVSGTLPAGLGLTPGSGEIEGVPTAQGTTDLTFEVSSGDGQTAQALLSLTLDVRILAPSELCSDYTSYAVGTFADNGLLGAVRSALGVNDSEPLTCALLATLTLLDARSLGITDLTGIQNLTSLDIAWLDDNDLTDLGPLSDMTWLDQLSMERNTVSDLGPLSGLTTLTYLAASSNSISNLTPMQGMVGLEKVFLGDNSISGISALSGLTSLSFLWIQENSITDVSPLAGLTALTDLGLTKNSITDIAPLTSLTGLTWLSVSGNPIGDVTVVGGLTNLEYLGLSGFAISDIGFLSGLTQLQFLDLNTNQVSDLGPLSGMTQLTDLYLRANQISDLSPLSGLTNLQTLVLAVNSITDISSLSGLADLRDLWLNANSITDVSVLEDKTQLTRLLLEANAGLADIQPLIDNVGLGTGDQVTLDGTSVLCTNVTLLENKGVAVTSDCP